MEVDVEVVADEVDVDPNEEVDDDNDESLVVDDDFDPDEVVDDDDESLVVSDDAVVTEDPVVFSPAEDAEVESCVKSEVDGESVTVEIDDDPLDKIDVVSFEDTDVTI